MPIFYKVERSYVKEHQGSFGAAFHGLEQRFKDSMEKINRWRMALRTVADIPGMDSSLIRPDSKLIEEIINDIWKRLYDIPSSDHLLRGMVGIDMRFEKLKSNLHLDTSHDVRIVGIWGMGGIGKTTLARVAFNRLSSEFDGCYFLEDVKKNSQKQLFSQLLNDNSFNKVNQFVITRLRRIKVLVVFDDVDDVELFEKLVGDLSWFCPGSRIMITTRDMQILNNIGRHEAYEVELQDSKESLELFSSKAFRAKSPTADFIEHSERVVSYAKGNPLALKVLGCHLWSRSITIWESELKKLEKVPNKKIHDVMKVSYDGLEQNEKDIFLDIAHFFKYVNRSLVEAILDASGRFAAIGIQELIDKSLLTIKHNEFLIHDLLKEMAFQIVRQESEEPGMRSRLCVAEEILSVLKYNKGTGVVQGMFLEANASDDDIQANSLVFKNMYDLRYLKFRDIWGKCKFPQGIHFLPDTLSCLHWTGYPGKALPSEFTPNHLVELRMRDNALECLWSGNPQLGRLKILDLQFCRNLKEVPDLSRAINLEILNLRCCERLYNLPHNIGKLESIKQIDLARTKIEQLPPSINRLSRLEVLNLYHCDRLKIVPLDLRKLKNLQHLYLGSCPELESISEIPEKMDTMTQFSIEATGITKLPNSIENLTAVHSLEFRNCIKLKSIPAEIYNMVLTNLNLSGCSKLTSLPPFSGRFEILENLNLSDTGILQLPEWVFSLPLLQRLNLSETNIERIPEIIKFSCLIRLDVLKCKLLQYLPELPPSLALLNATGCASMEAMSLSSKMHEKSYVDDAFLFWNCINLDRKSIQEEFLTRSFRSKELGAGGGPIFMCYPGNQTPEWCLNRKEGCSINVSSLNFMELAFSVVVEKVYDDNNNDLDIPFMICTTTHYGSQVVTVHRIFFAGINTIELEHVIMFYKGYIDLKFSSPLELSFNLYNIKYWETNCRIKWCGYGLITPRNKGKRIIGSEFCGFNPEKSSLTKKLKF